MGSKFAHAAWGLLVLLGIGLTLLAQDNDKNAIVAIRVTDVSGAAVEGAEVRFVDQARKGYEVKRTDKTGRAMAELRPGEYALEVRALRFKSAVIHYIEVAAAEHKQFEVSLESPVPGIVDPDEPLIEQEHVQPPDTEIRERFSPAQDASPKPRVSSESLTKEQVAVYRAVLQNFLADSTDTLNLANTTEPLDQAPASLGRGCSNTSARQISGASDSVVHHLDPVVTLNLRVDLVDPGRLEEKIKNGDPAILMKRVIEDRENVPQKEIDDATERAVQNGLFTLSEVAFNKQHNRALVSYDFVCGELCGHGSVLLLRKVGGNWKVHKTCQEWFR
jgi:hypothetical protein